MAFPDEPQGASAPSDEHSPEIHSPEHNVTGQVITSAHTDEDERLHRDSDELESYTDEWSSSYGQTAEPIVLTPPAPPPPPANPPPKSPPAGGSGRPPKPPEPPDEDDAEEEGMARMSFLEHLEELRTRILRALAGMGIAFAVCLTLGPQLWEIIRQPAKVALVHLGVDPPNLALIDPMDAFQIVWMKIPLLCAIFVSSPWILYQVWSFIAPGLYKKERRWAAPFVISSSLLFIVGGLFAYFFVFRYGLEFLLGIGITSGMTPTVDVNRYYDLFVDVMLGVGAIFEIPVMLFLLTLIHVASPAFLVRHSRYAILIIVVAAAVITPTGDIFNLTLFATPMILLFYVGIFASYLLVLHREKRRFPWAIFLKWAGLGMVVLSIISYFAARYYGYHLVSNWPFLTR
jgi:sec-independent protein translocase protein TatC